MSKRVATYVRTVTKSATGTKLNEGLALFHVSPPMQSYGPDMEDARRLFVAGATDFVLMVPGYVPIIRLIDGSSATQVGVQLWATDSDASVIDLIELNSRDMDKQPTLVAEVIRTADYRQVFAMLGYETENLPEELAIAPAPEGFRLKNFYSDVNGSDDAGGVASDDGVEAYSDVGGEDVTGDELGDFGETTRGQSKQKSSLAS